MIVKLPVILIVCWSLSVSPAIAQRVLAQPLQPSRSESAVETPPPRLDSPRLVLGVQVEPGSEGGYPGMVIRGFDPRSLLGEAGLRAGDLIVLLNGQRITSRAEIAGALANLRAGQFTDIQIFRGGQLFRTQVKVIELTPTTPETIPPPSQPALAADDPKQPAATQTPSLGLDIQDAKPDRGVVVVSVVGGGSGASAGIRPGDRIVSAQGRLLREADDLAREISVRKPGDSVTMGIIRDGRLIEVEVSLEGPPEGKGVAATPRDSDKASDSVAGTVGSMLGGLFGGGKPATKTEPAKTVAPAKTVDPLALPEDK